MRRIASILAAVAIAIALAWHYAVALFDWVERWEAVSDFVLPYLQPARDWVAHHPNWSAAGPWALILGTLGIVAASYGLPHLLRWWRIRPLQILWDVRPMRGRYGDQGEYYSAGVRNNSRATLHGVTLRAKESFFVEHTVATVRIKRVNGMPMQDREPILITIDHLDPEATEITQLFGLTYNEDRNPHDVLAQVQRFVLEARARDVPTVLEMFEYDPRARPMIKKIREVF